MKIKIQWIITAIAVIFLTACRQDDNTEWQGNQHMLLSVLYQQQAAESDALSYQAYKLARIRLDLLLIEYSDTMKPAIVLDIDETVLDNSPYEAKCIIDNINYPQDWDVWINKAEAAPIPGSVDFIKYAKARGVEIFYITNRKQEFKEATFSNMRNIGLPYVDEEHVLMRKEESSKKGRRNFVKADHNILLLIGDDLEDFSEIFEGLSSNERIEKVAEMNKELNDKWIILPNPIYGNWLYTILEYKEGLSETEMKELMISKLENFSGK